MHNSVLKLGLLLPLFLTASPMSVISQMKKAKENLTKTQQEILQIEEKIFTAVNNQDAGALEQILTDNFVYRSPGNPEVGKQDFLKLSATFPYKILSIWGEEMRVNVFGDTAVLTGLQFAKTQSGDGKEETSVVMFTDVFVMMKGKWMLTLAHAVDLPKIPEKYSQKK